MNLVAKEFVASKEMSQAGVLILSEMAGASNELMEALIVNPHDTQHVIEAMRMALEMNKAEQRWRLKKMQERLKKYNVKNWAETFIRSQGDLLQKPLEEKVNLLDTSTLDLLLSSYRQAKQRLLILDYDGTLMEFQNDPEAVIPDETLLRILKALASDPNNLVVINTGRDRRTIEKWLGHLDIEFAAEHGGWLKRKKNWEKHPSLQNTWKKDIRPILDELVERTPGSHVEEKEYALAWHYRRIDKDLGARRIREFRDVLQYLTNNLGLQVLEGSKVLEVKNARVSKGKATLNWLQEKKWDFLFAIGDDKTDEDTFEALPLNAFSIKVGIMRTAARFNVRSVKMARELLQKMAG